MTDCCRCHSGAPCRCIVVHPVGDGFPRSKTFEQPSFPRRRESLTQPSFPRRREGGFTFQVQHAFQEYFCRGLVVQALSRGIVVGLNHLCKRLHRQRRQVGLAGQSPPQPADGVLHPALLPRGVGIAEEGFDTQIVESVMEGELGPVVEGNRPSPFGRQLTEHLRHGAGDGTGCLARGSDGNEDAGVAFVHDQHRMSICPEQHQVRLPVAGSAAVSGALGALGNRASHSHEGGRTAPSAASPAPLRLGTRQVVSPPIVLGTRELAVYEPVDALVGDDPPTSLQLEPTGNLLGRPAPFEA